MPKIQTGDMEKWRVEFRLFVAREQKRFAIANQSHVFDEIVLAALEKNKHVDLEKENYIKLEAVDEESVKNLDKFLERSLDKCQQREQHDLIQQSLRKTLQTSRRQSILMQQNQTGFGAPLEPFCLFCASNLDNGQPHGQLCATHAHPAAAAVDEHQTIFTFQAQQGPPPPRLEAQQQTPGEHLESYVDAPALQLPPTPPIAPTPPISCAGQPRASNGSRSIDLVSAKLQARLSNAIKQLEEENLSGPRREQPGQAQQRPSGPPPVLPAVQVKQQQARARPERDEQRHIKVDGTDTESDGELDNSRKLVIAATPVQPAQQAAARMVASVQPTPSPSWTGVKTKKTRKKARASHQANGR